MGQSSANKTPKQTELSSLTSQFEEYYDQFFEVQQCCGFHCKKAVKKQLLWEQNLIKNCLELKPYYKWPQEIIEVIKTRKIFRKRYLQEFNDLKYQQRQPAPQEKQILLSPSEIEDFKKNLKKSVLLSYGQAVNPPRPKQPSKIESVIIPPPSRPGPKIRSDIYIEQFRKSAILPETSFRHSQKSGKSILRQSIMSFVDDTMASMFRAQEKQISKQSAQSLQIFVSFTVMLERHLTDPSNKIRQVMETFYLHLQRNFKKQSINSVQMEFLTNSIKVFLVLLREMVEDFYNTRSFAQWPDDCHNNFLISNSENILTVVTAIFFKDQKFYHFLLQIIREFNKQRESKFEAIIGRLIGKPPQFFEIKREYCLNNATIQKYIQEMSSIDSCLENLAPEELESTGDQPYLKCSKCLKLLQKTKTPISKMKVIMECSSKITECVAEFYANNSLDLKQQILDADQVLSIFCYILTVAHIKNLQSHLFIVEHFATDHQLISVTGYYYSVLTCAVQQLQKSYGSQQYQSQSDM